MRIAGYFLACFFFVYLNMEESNGYKTNEPFFLADYSHEIRNPLNGITGLIEILKDSGLNSEQKSLLKSMQIKNSQLQLALNHMLEYSKLLSGNIKSYPEQLLIFPFLQKILDDLFQIYRKERIKLCYFLPPELSGIAVIDPILIRQVIIEIGKYVMQQGNMPKINLEISIQSSDLVLEFLQAPTDDIDTNTSIINSASTKNISFILTQGILKLIGGTIENQTTSSILLRLPIKCAPLIGDSHKKSTKDILKNKNIIFYNYQSDTCGSIRKHLKYWGMSFHSEDNDFNPNRWNKNDDKYQIIGVDLSDSNQHEFIVIDEIRKVSKLPIILFKEADNNLQKLLTLQKDVVVLYKPISSKDLAFVLESVIQSEVNKLREWIRNPFSLISEYKDTIKILIAEDDPINQRVMHEYFNKLHLKVDIAPNGKLATEWYEQHKYDLIFMDINMPEMDGVEATQKIRSIKNDHHPYIIAITADALKGDKKTYSDVGMDDFLFKPVNIEKLQKKISDYIQSLRH